MIANYYTLRALAAEWDAAFTGMHMTDAYTFRSQELTLAFTAPDDHEAGLKISTRPGLVFAFSESAPRRPKANVASLFDAAIGRRVTSVTIADGDRVVTIHFEHGGGIAVYLFGSRANVYFFENSASARTVIQAFKRSELMAGKELPDERPPRPIPDADTLAVLLGSTEPTDRAIRKLVPNLAGPYVQEAMARAGAEAGEAVRVARELAGVARELAQGTPHIYEDGEDGILLSLCALSGPLIILDRSFPNLNEAVRFTALRRARTNRLSGTRKPLLNALERSRDRWSRRVSDLQEATTSVSRADQYERWGHLLMANPYAGAANADRVELHDILGDGSMVAIPLDPRKSVIMNAERYYQKARDVREERGHLAARLSASIASRDTVDAILESVLQAGTTKEVEQIKKKYADELQRFVGGRTHAIASSPFKRFRLSTDLEVWVGRNASENDKLTFQYAAKHDLWFHARAVPGSHVVLRVPGRDATIAKHIQEEAAAIAAWFSSARGSGLVPVQVTLRKHVTKPRGAVAGTVRLSNERVLLVEPRLPEHR